MHYSVLRECFFFCIPSAVDSGVSIFIIFLLDLLVSALSFSLFFLFTMLSTPIYDIYNALIPSLSLYCCLSIPGDVLFATLLFFVIFLCYMLILLCALSLLPLV